MAENLHGYTWAFQDVVATLNGPGGVITLGQGAGVATEGMTVSYTEEKDTVVTGADGSIQHSLRAGQTGRISVRLQRTSPTNRLLSQLYNFQRQFSPNWGQNTIAVSNVATGDQQVGAFMAFVKHPDIQYATEGGMVEWEFVGIVESDLGAGVAGLASAPVG
jgi:hypothetical protein